MSDHDVELRHCHDCGETWPDTGETTCHHCEGGNTEGGWEPPVIVEEVAVDAPVALTPEGRAIVERALDRFRGEDKDESWRKTHGQRLTALETAATVERALSQERLEKLEAATVALREALVEVRLAPRLAELEEKMAELENLPAGWRQGPSS